MWLINDYAWMLCCVDKIPSSEVDVGFVLPPWAALMHDASKSKISKAISVTATVNCRQPTVLRNEFTFCACIKYLRMYHINKQ